MTGGKKKMRLLNAIVMTTTIAVQIVLYYVLPKDYARIAGEILGIPFMLTLVATAWFVYLDGRHA